MCCFNLSYIYLLSVLYCFIRLFTPKICPETVLIYFIFVCFLLFVYCNIFMLFYIYVFFISHILLYQYEKITICISYISTSFSLLPHNPLLSPLFPNVRQNRSYLPYLSLSCHTAKAGQTQCPTGFMPSVYHFTESVFLIQISFFFLRR